MCDTTEEIWSTIEKQYLGPHHRITPIYDILYICTKYIYIYNINPLEKSSEIRSRSLEASGTVAVLQLLHEYDRLVQIETLKGLAPAEQAREVKALRSCVHDAVLGSPQES